jgi:CheY-like chemotaxis protein
MPQPLPPAAERNHQDRIQMSKRLVEMAGGRLDIATGGIQGRSYSASIALPVSHRATVLVIDDNTDTRRLFKRYLSHTDYSFAGTGDPREALMLAQTLSPDVIVLDVMIPGTDGWKLLAHLRQHPKTHDIPTVVCTILSEREAALTLGASEFIRKPVSRATFLKMLERQLRPSP